MGKSLEALNDPARENAFRQYSLNQWVSQCSLWMPMHLYAVCTGTSDTPPTRLLEPHAGRPPGGLDLASKMDMTAWCLIIPNGIDGRPSALWRF